MFIWCELSHKDRAHEIDRMHMYAGYYKVYICVLKNIISERVFVKLPDPLRCYKGPRGSVNIVILLRARALSSDQRRLDAAPCSLSAE